jgi:hypothetical protein
MQMLIRKVTGYCIARVELQLDPTLVVRIVAHPSCLQVTMSDFKHSLDEIKPAFGAESDTLKLYAVHGILSCGDAFDHIMHTLRTLVHQVGAAIMLR